MTTHITEFCDGVLALDAERMEQLTLPSRRTVIHVQQSEHAPALARALKKAVQAINAESHATDCDLQRRPFAGQCDCWKSRALAEIAELIPKQ